MVFKYLVAFSVICYVRCLLTEHRYFTSELKHIAMESQMKDKSLFISYQFSDRDGNFIAERFNCILVFMCVTSFFLFNNCRI